MDSPALNVPFTVTFVERSSPDTTTLAVSGELTEITPEDLFGAIADNYRPNQTLQLDFAEVTFLTSIGIRALVRLSQAYRSAGGRVTIANPRPLVLQVLDISGLTETFGITPTSPATE